jgi:hypothetical protein
MRDTSNPRKRSTVKHTLIVLGVLLVMGAPLMIADIRGRKSLDPTGHATSLAEYLEWQPAATEFEEATFAGKRHFIASGPEPTSSLASGPPAYVFDETGRLVDWSTDTGEDSEFCTRWDATSQPGYTTFGRDAAEELANSLAPP